jgi:hypothetical protein
MIRVLFNINLLVSVDRRDVMWQEEKGKNRTFFVIT